MLMLEEFRDVLAVKCGNEINGQVLYWTTLYFYKNLIIDTGCPHTAYEVKDFFKDREFDVVLVTHHHEDHAGGAFMFEKVYAPEKTLEILRNPQKIPKYRQLVWGQPKPVIAEPLKSRMEFDNVSVEVVETPGHSFDHVCFLIDDKLFMGDLIGSKRLVICMRDEDYIGVIESIKKVLKLDFEKAYGGHVVLTKDEVKDFLNYLLDLKDRTDELYNKGKTVEEIVNTLLSDVPQKVILMEQMSEMEWARANLIRSLLGPLGK
jgi:glyoxylase-like metal-dependent hydrolase (beta-lactamase superfamily II)